MAMEKCDRVVVVSAIFNDHDKIRQPKGIGAKTIDSVCFFMLVDDVTLNGLYNHNLIPRTSKDYKVGVWRIIKVQKENLYENAAMNGVIPKYLLHRLFPNTKFSIWIDAKLQLVVDPLLLIHSLVIKENVDMAISRHPFYVHTMEEAMATARWKKWWDIDSLKTQMETYCENGLEPWSPKKPYPSGTFQSFIFIIHLILTQILLLQIYNFVKLLLPSKQFQVHLFVHRSSFSLRYTFLDELSSNIIF